MKLSQANEHACALDAKGGKSANMLCVLWPNVNLDNIE